MPCKAVASSYVTLDGSSDEPGAWSFPFWPEGAAPFTAPALVASTDGSGGRRQTAQEAIPEADERSPGASGRRHTTTRRLS